MKKIIEFSKSYGNITKIKKDFYDGNIKNLKNALRINNIYKNQPLRKNCKNCDSRKIKSFIKNFNIPYKLCSRCGHLNGAFQDTNIFAKKLYIGYISPLIYFDHLTRTIQINSNELYQY